MSKEEKKEEAAVKEAATKSVKHDSPESAQLQGEGWIVTEIKNVDGVKMHFLKKP